MSALPKSISPLSPAEFEVLHQLWMNGPVWDGNLCGKHPRDLLYHAALIDRHQGFNFLTKAGVDMAIALFNCDPKSDKTR